MSDFDIAVRDAWAAATWIYDCSVNVLAGVDCAVRVSCYPVMPVFPVEFRYEATD